LPGKFILVSSRNGQVGRLDRPNKWVKFKIPTKIWRFRESAGKEFFGLLNLFKQLKNSNGAIEKCANEFG
jgi:hypothetical protein